ncbi:MAG: hypothetical protein WC492_00825 [Candidatus Micrarchaeia archaeon]
MICKKTVGEKFAFAKRGQASVEIMVYLGFFMLMFVFFSLFIISDFNNEVQQRKFLMAKETANQIADYANFVLEAGPGTAANFSIPSNINGKDYNLTFTSSGWMYVNVQDDDVGMISFPHPIGYKNYRMGCLHEPQCPKNFERTYVDLFAPYTVYSIYVVDGQKGWLYLNYSSDKFGERIEVG